MPVQKAENILISANGHPGAVQIEYEYTAGDESSVRLLKWYEVLSVLGLGPERLLEFLSSSGF